MILDVPREKTHLGLDHSSCCMAYLAPYRELLELHEGQLLSRFNMGERSFVNIDLRNCLFSWSNLQDIQLNRSSLQSVRFEGANLAHASFRCSDLSNANFAFANLVGVDFTGANLSHANLSYANLSYANLTGANLTEANLEEANYQHADFTAVNLTRTILANGPQQCPIDAVEADDARLFARHYAFFRQQLMRLAHR